MLVKAGSCEDIVTDTPVGDYPDPLLPRPAGGDGPSEEEKRLHALIDKLTGY